MISQRYKRLVEKFNQLPQGLRKALTLAGVLCAILLGVYGLLLPAHQFANEAARQYRDKQALLAWMRENESVLRESSQPPGSTADSVTEESLLSILADSAQSQQIAFKRFEPQGATTRIRLENIPFNRLILWLDDLQKLHDIHTKQVTVSGRDSPGRVDVVIVVGTD